MNHDKADDSTPAFPLLSIFRGLYQRVAVKLGVDPSYVSRVARGERKSAAVLAALQEEMDLIRQHLNRLDGPLADGNAKDGELQNGKFLDRKAQDGKAPKGAAADARASNATTSNARSASATGRDGHRSSDNEAKDKPVKKPRRILTSGDEKVAD
jgi:transcriptional regulator with XRE-family HTH domain